MGMSIPEDDMNGSKLTMRMKKNLIKQNSPYNIAQ